MRIFATLAYVVSLAGLYVLAALAQGPGTGAPRTLPPEAPARTPAQPGTAPAIAVPATPGTAAPADNRSREAASRCAELSGAMREQCLLEQQGGATGATSAPEPRPAPPPQNPR